MANNHETVEELKLGEFYYIDEIHPSDGYYLNTHFNKKLLGKRAVITRLSGIYNLFDEDGTKFFSVECVVDGIEEEPAQVIFLAVSFRKTKEPVTKTSKKPKNYEW